MSTRLQTATVDVIEAARLWNARRINRNPGAFRPELYNEACTNLAATIGAYDQIIVEEKARASIAGPPDDVEVVIEVDTTQLVENLRHAALVVDVADAMGVISTDAAGRSEEAMH